MLNTGIACAYSVFGAVRQRVSLLKLYNRESLNGYIILLCYWWRYLPEVVFTGAGPVNTADNDDGYSRIY